MSRINWCETKYIERMNNLLIDLTLVIKQRPRHKAKNKSLLYVCVIDHLKEFFFNKKRICDNFRRPQLWEIKKKDF